MATCGECRFFIDRAMRKWQRNGYAGLCLNSKSPSKYVNKSDNCEFAAPEVVM